MAQQKVQLGNTKASNVDIQNANFTELYTDISDLSEAVSNAGKVDDVQINGSSIVASKVADIPIMTSSKLGVAKLGSDTVQTTSAAAVTTTSSRTYAVQKNSSNQLVVNVPWQNTNTDTHYTANLYIGATSTNSNATTTNGNTYIKLYETVAGTATKRNEYYIKGSDATSVSSDSSGNITITSTNTKNTAGSTNNTAKLFLIGATSQAANPQTYSNAAVYMQDGKLYVGGDPTSTDYQSADWQVITTNEFDNYKDNIEGTVDNAYSRANEAYTLAEGRSRAYVFATVTAMTTALKKADKTDYRVGDNLFITATGVPDYWISAVLTTNTGTYGYYEISELETQKVDLSGYQTTTDSSLKTTATTVVDAINEVKSTADTAKSNAATAQSTANSAVSSASTNATAITNITSGTTKVGKAGTADKVANSLSIEYSDSGSGTSIIHYDGSSEYLIQLPLLKSVSISSMTSTTSNSRYVYSYSIGNFRACAFQVFDGSGNMLDVDIQYQNLSGFSVVITSDIDISTGYLTYIQF